MQIICPGCGSAYALNAPLPPHGSPCPRCGAQLLPQYVVPAAQPGGYVAPAQNAYSGHYPTQYPTQPAAPPYPAPGYGLGGMPQQNSAAWGAQPVMPPSPMAAPTYPPSGNFSPSLPAAYAPKKSGLPSWAIPTMIAAAAGILVSIGMVVWSLSPTREPTKLVASTPAAPSAAPATPPPKKSNDSGPTMPKQGMLDGLKSAAGFGDSHDKILSEFIAKAKTLPPLFQSIQDVPSRDRAISRLSAMNKEIDELILRVARLEPLAPAEHKAMLDRHKAGIQMKQEGNKEDMQRLQTAGLMSEEFSSVLFEFVFTLGEFMTAINEGILALPEPKNDDERFVRDVLQLRRDVNRTLAKTKSAAEYKQLPAAVTAQLNKLEDLNKQTSNTSSGGGMFPMAESTYLRFQSQAAQQTTTLQTALQRTYGENAELTQQLAQFSSRSTHIVSEKRFGRGGGSVAQNNPAQNNAGQNYPGPPGPVFGPPGSGFPTPGAQAAIDQFRAREGAQNTLVISFEGQTTDEQSARYRQELLAMTGNGTHSSQNINGKLTIIVKHSGDVEQFSKQIQFGRVVSVSTAQRTIVVAGR